MPTDIAIGTANLPTGTPILKKPVYLIVLVDGSGKTATETNFIATDRPDLSYGFVSVRGIYCEADKEEIVKNFAELVNKAPKDTVLEMVFPAHRIKSIRSLVFNAVKPTMVSR